MLHNIFVIVTACVTFILGIIAKKNKKIKNEMIPLQNLIVGIITSFIYYLITKDFSMTITSVGLFTGGIYDIVNNLNKLIKQNKEEVLCQIVLVDNKFDTRIE